MGKKKKKNNYFGAEVDKAIIQFQKSSDPKEKEKLCGEIIIPAFKKISSYWYNRLPVAKNEESIHDAVAYLYEKMGMFNPEKKTSGFAYFNMIARNYFFQKLRSEKKEITSDIDIISNIYEMNDESLLNNDALVEENIEKDLENREFIELLKERLPLWENKAKKEQEKKVLNALITIFKNIDNIDIYKRKGIFFLIGEITNLNQKQIALNLSKIKKKYIKFKKKYQRGEI